MNRRIHEDVGYVLGDELLAHRGRHRNLLIETGKLRACEESSISQLVVSHNIGVLGLVVSRWL